MGRRPIGERALTNAEKQRKYRQIRSAKKTKGAKIKDKEWHRASRNAIKNDPEQYKEYKRKERGASGKETKKAAENAGPDLVNMKFPAFSRSLNKVKNSLPKKHTQKRAVVKALFEQTINLTPKKRRILSNWAKIKHTDFSAKGRKTLLSEDIKEKIDKFLCRSDISYTLPGRNKQVYLGKIEGVSRFLPKKYLLWTYKELTTLIQQEDEDLANLKFSTLYRYTNSKKEYVIQSKIPEVACLCPDCENLELLCNRNYSMLYRNAIAFKMPRVDRQDCL